jgi:hypothetical protein
MKVNATIRHIKPEQVGIDIGLIVDRGGYEANLCLVQHGFYLAIAGHGPVKPPETSTLVVHQRGVLL